VNLAINILAGMLFVLVALVLYSIGVWGAFRRKGARRRDLTFLWLGFAFDVLATLMMSIQQTSAVLAKAAGSFIVTLSLGSTTLVLMNDVKTYLALLAMLGMLASTIVATRAFTHAREGLARTVSRVIVAPWALWVVVFFIGAAANIPKR
jgi:hypothetical protein